MKKQILISITFIIVVSLITLMCYQKESFRSTTDDHTVTLTNPNTTILAQKNDCKDLDSLKNLVEQHMKEINGEYQWGFHIFESDCSYKTESKRVPSASVIKLFIMEYAYDLSCKQEIELQSTLQGRTIASLIESMITVSDNYSTNVLIDYFGMDNLNAYFREKGYKDTELQRKMLDTAAMAAGRDNYTSLDDVMLFLDSLYTNKDKYPHSEMLEIMKRQQIKTKIQKYMPPDVTIASKTGELSNVENDVAIVFLPDSDFSIVFLTSNLYDTYSAREAIANATYDLYKQITQIQGE